MSMPKLRFSLLAIALTLAAALSVSALLYAASPAVSASSAEQVTAAEAPPPPQEQPADVPEESPAAPEPLYVLRDVDGELCIFRNSRLLRHTGVYTASLPREDRELLAGGIAAGSEQALASLLEDLCS